MPVDHRSIVTRLFALVVSAAVVLDTTGSHPPRPGRVANAAATQPVVRPQSSHCGFAEAPVVVKRSGSAVLQFWTVAERSVLRPADLPRDSAFLEFRRTIERAGADLLRPVADPPRIRGASDAEVWRLEARNEELAYSGRAGLVRPARCLDALLFAYQNTRYPQLSHPTEFIASILRREVNGEWLLRIYFSASDMLFPPQDYYGFDEIEKELAAGWEFWAVLHNHTVRSYRGALALGVPAPSTSDVDLLRSLVGNLGLRNAWITNGFFTIEIPAVALDQYVGRP